MTDMFLVMACPWVIFECHVFVSLIYETSMVILCSVMDGCYSTGVSYIWMPLVWEFILWNVDSDIIFSDGCLLIHEGWAINWCHLFLNLWYVESDIVVCGGDAFLPTRGDYWVNLINVPISKHDFYLPPITRICRVLY